MGQNVLSNLRIANVAILARNSFCFTAASISGWFLKVNQVNLLWVYRNHRVIL